jgi:hypothetical protein
VPRPAHGGGNTSPETCELPGVGSAPQHCVMTDLGKEYPDANVQVRRHLDASVKID